MNKMLRFALQGKHCSTFLDMEIFL